MEVAHQLLKRRFGYTAFRLHQEEIIGSLLAGRDVLALMPTGGGKSICYQIPAMLRPGTGVVVSPLIALMQDQVDTLNQLGIRAAFLNSSQDPEIRRQVEQQLHQGKLDLLYLAPERLLSPATLNLLDQVGLALFAIDEAHCVSQWGHDFRPEYRQLSMLAQRYTGVPRIALTATADSATRREMLEQLCLQQADQYVNSFDRPNIRYLVNDGGNARQRLWSFIREQHPQDAGIVYCLSRKKVEATAEWLADQGRIALPYHAGMSSQQRAINQARFLREEGVIMVATIAFGMGIDKPDVRFVAHLNLPRSVEAYYQETGRAGRDGKPADAWLAYGLQDVITLRQMCEQSEADASYKRVVMHKLEAMLGFCELSDCRRQALLGYFDETLSQPCGNCDNCQSPPDTWDATEPARKALSSVYRCGQRFGVNYLVDVLLGKSDDPRIQANGHDRLSVFGIGKEMDSREWRNLMRQLIARGFLQIEPEGHGALKLDPRCRPLLRGERGLQLRKSSPADKTRERASKRKLGSSLRHQDQALFDALRAWRQETAQRLDVPPYVVFHDATLEQLARQRPESRVQLAQISGIGERKLERYGEALIRILAEHRLPKLLDNSLSETVNASLALHLQGLDPAGIARERQLNESTIYVHLAQAIAVGLLEARNILSLTEESYDRIVDAIEFTGEPDGGLKPVFEALDGEFDYGVIRCVAAGLGRTG